MRTHVHEETAGQRRFVRETDRDRDTSPEPPSKRALVAGAVGNFIEWYDFVLYGASAAILADVFFPSANPTASLMATFATFGVAFVARPFGAVILGNLGDRAGRRNVLAAVVIGMSICTALVGFLPSYAAIGAAAPILLVVLRAVQGFTAGGEFGGSATFMVEYAPHGRRGWYGAWQTATVGLGSATATAMVVIVTTVLPDDAVQSWGWRLPFLLALPLGIAGLYLRLRLEDTPEFQRVEESGEKREMPVVEAFRNHAGRIFAGAAIVTGATLSIYVFHNYVPTYLNKTFDVPLNIALLGNLVGILFWSAFALMFGRLSDRFGRKPFLVGGAVALLALLYPAFRIDQEGTLPAIILGQTLFAIAVTPIIGLVPTVLSEFFPTAVRYSALSVSYTLANAVFGGTAPLVVTFLSDRTGSDISAVVYCMAGALISLIGALYISETARRPLRHA